MLKLSKRCQSALPALWQSLVREACRGNRYASHAAQTAKSMYIINTEGRRSASPVLLGLFEHFEGLLGPHVGFYQVRICITDFVQSLCLRDVGKKLSRTPPIDMRALPCLSQFMHPVAFWR